VIQSLSAGGASPHSLERRNYLHRKESLQIARAKAGPVRGAPGWTDHEYIKEHLTLLWH